MTRLDPSIFVRRFVIERDGYAAYDEKFHEGVNIIRGENSSGKSTILNFLFYGLGGDISEWSEHAQLCSKTFAEVELNGNVATLSRGVAKVRGQAMEIYPGPLNEAVRATRASWKRHPYARSADNEGFSQVLFRLIGIPDAASEQSSNITMHQVLRLMYADQLTPVDQIFKFEQFDSPSLRDAVGQLVCGVNSNQYYANQLTIRQLEREYDGVAAEQRSLFRILGKTDEQNTTDWLIAERSVLEEKLRDIRSNIDAQEAAVYLAADEEKLSLKTQNDAYSRVQDIQIRIGKDRSDFDALEFEIADSDKFIHDLEHKLKALSNAEAVSQDIDEVRFQFCPACYSPVDEETTSFACHLCKTPYDSERAKLRIVALINDTALQLKQSNRIQRDRRAERASLQTKIEGELQQWRQLAAGLEALRRSPSSDARAALGTLQREAGYVEHQIEDLTRREAVASLISELSARKESLNGRIAQLRARNENIALEQRSRLSKAYTEIADEVCGFLRADLPRQAEFQRAEQIQFSFETNKIAVDGHSYFSASSRVVLRNSFFAGLLYAACGDAAFRHPRFCMMDSIEDKGMEQVRSHHYQRLLFDRSNKTSTRHQLIFGTSMLAPELDSHDITVGKFSTEGDKTLDFTKSKVIEQILD